MSRASVATASARAEAWRNFAFFRPSAARASSFPAIAIRSLPAALVRRLGSLVRDDYEALVRWSVPVVLVAFIGILVAISFSFTYREQDRIVAEATADIDLFATMIADDIDMRARVEPAAIPSDILARAMPARALAHGQTVLVSDPAGQIVAGYPAQPKAGSIIDLLGATQPLTIFAEKAGVMHLAMPDGSEALATVRSLQAPLGQVVVIHPMDGVLGDWRGTLIRTFVLVGCVTAVLVALALAYFWQAARARQAGSSCRAMRDRVDMVLARGRCGLWDWNLATGSIDWSLSMFDLVGIAPRREGRLSFAEVDALIHPEDGGLDALKIPLTLGRDHAIDHVFRIRNAAGGWVWLRAKAEMIDGAGGQPHLVGIAIDITETMALEERTARADLRLRDAIETISEAFVVWDADNRLVLCNSKFQRFHDLPADAVVPGTPYAQVMERGTPHLVHAQIQLSEPQPMGARTFEAQLGDGHWLQINERRTKDGGYVSVGTDITALKRNAEQLIDNDARLRNYVVDINKARQEAEVNQQRLAILAEELSEQKRAAENANRAKSDFLANMGHELRTPLNAILGFSEIMMNQAFGPLGSPNYQGYSRDIHESGQSLLRVIADVLEMSRLEAGRVRLEKEDFALGGAVEAAIAAVQDIADQGRIEIRNEADSDAFLHADRAAVEKILTVLLNNAVKYTPVDGRVTVRSRAVQGAMHLYVEDTGVGIPPEAIARLGKPFEQSEQTLRNGMRGSGLGLAIASSLVELHKGRLRISSRQGAGTSVTFDLPNRFGTQRPQLQLAPVSVRASTRGSRFALQPSDNSVRKISRTA